VTTYQLLDPLPADVYEALKADIAERGMVYPVVLDETGAVLDGHHRKRIAKELGVTCPTSVLPGLSEEQKLDVGLALNLTGRRQTREEKRETIRRYLLRRPDVSDRHAAQVTGASGPTVAKVRAELEANAKILHYGDRVEEAGRKARGRKPRGPDPAAVAQRQAEKETKRVRDAARREAEQAARKDSDDRIRAEAIARGGAVRESLKAPARVVATQDRVKAALNECIIALIRALQDPGLDVDLMSAEQAVPAGFRITDVGKQLQARLTEFRARLKELDAERTKTSRTERESPVREK